MVNSNLSSRKDIIDKVSGMLQVLITDYEFKSATYDLPEKDFVKLCNKSAGEIVQVVLDYERAKALQQLVDIEQQKDNAYQRGLEIGYDTGWLSAIDSISTAD